MQRSCPASIPRQSTYYTAGSPHVPNRHPRRRYHAGYSSTPRHSTSPATSESRRTYIQYCSCICPYCTCMRAHTHVPRDTRSFAQNGAAAPPTPPLPTPPSAACRSLGHTGLAHALIAGPLLTLAAATNLQGNKKQKKHLSARLASPRSDTRVVDVHLRAHTTQEPRLRALRTTPSQVHTVQRPTAAGIPSIITATAHPPHPLWAPPPPPRRPPQPPTRAARRG